MSNHRHRPSPLQGVRERQEAQRVISWGDVEEGVKCLQLSQRGPMADHDPLGLTRGSRGVNQRGNIVGA